MAHSPSINFVQNRLGFCFAVLVFKVFTHPLDEVVLEYSFDELVKQIWSDELIDVGIGEVFSKWLDGNELDLGWQITKTYSL